MRTLVIAIVCLLAAPLWAELAEPAEAHSTLGALKDRLRVMYRDNGNRIDANWTLADLLPEKELNGTYFKAADYSLQFDAARPSWARLQCRGGGYYKGPLAIEVDLATGAGEWHWPGPSEAEKWAERKEALLVFAALWFGPLMLVPVFLRRRLRADIRAVLWMLGSGLWLVGVPVFAAVVLEMFITEHTREPAASTISLCLLLGLLLIPTGVGMLIVARIFPAEAISEDTTHRNLSGPKA